MTSSDLHREVQSTLAGKSLGTPVFVRYHLQSRERAAAVPRRLAQIVDVVRNWLARPLERVYALGSAKAGHVTLLLELRGGFTAVVSWAAGDDAIDLTVLGNHGALYHDAGAASCPTDPPTPATLALVERALRSTSPERAKKGEGA